MDKLNLIKNSMFALGKTSPQAWSWHSDGDASRWTHEVSQNGQAVRVMLIESKRRGQSAEWSQTVRCKPAQDYRLEADLACDCRPADEDSGVLLTVRFHGESGPVGDVLSFALVHHSSRRTILRGYFCAPEDAHRVELRVGVVRACGWARVYDVRMMKTLELDACAHVLAVPPPAYADDPPRRVRRVAVCAETDECSVIGEVLRAGFGAGNVKLRSPRAADLERSGADAIVIPGDVLPSGVREVGRLEELARNRVVVISLGAFAKLARPNLELRTIEQKDDPLHARIACGCFISSGFAMQDVFPFAGVGETAGSLTQRQFVTSRAFGEFRKNGGYEVFLTSETDSDKTMDKPIGLFKRFKRGAVVVCDLDALEAPPTLRGEANLSATLLLNMLGRAPRALGQFAVAATSERSFRSELLDLELRYRQFTCEGIHRSTTSVDGVVVRLGRDEVSFGRMPAPRPAVVVRTGLRGGDEEGIYGTKLWLRRLFQPLPYPCAYARYLTGRYRVLWLPLQRRWNAATCMSLDAWAPRAAGWDDSFGETRVMVDVTVGTGNRLRVVVNRRGPLFQRFARALPALSRAIKPDRFVAYAPEPGGPIRDLDGYAWRRFEVLPEVAVEARGFSDPMHRAASEAGADLVRIELPRALGDLTGDSIRRTDLAAGTLEHVLGLACDLFVMNHTSAPIELDPTDVLGESCSEYRLVTTDPQTGTDRAECVRTKSAKTIRLAPGTAICR